MYLDFTEALSKKKTWRIIAVGTAAEDDGPAPQND
jgi:hypothetical protein